MKIKNLLLLAVTIVVFSGCSGETKSSNDDKETATPPLPLQGIGTQHDPKKPYIINYGVTFTKSTFEHPLRFNKDEEKVKQAMKKLQDHMNLGISNSDLNFRVKIENYFIADHPYMAEVIDPDENSTRSPREEIVMSMFYKTGDVEALWHEKKIDAGLLTRGNGMRGSAGLHSCVKRFDDGSCKAWKVDNFSFLGIGKNKETNETTFDGVALHEMGHSMALRHGALVPLGSDANGNTTYQKGWEVDWGLGYGIPGRFTTIMAYGDEYADTSINPTAWKHEGKGAFMFSNPNMECEGKPKFLGCAIGEYDAHKDSDFPAYCNIDNKGFWGSRRSENYADALIYEPIPYYPCGDAKTGNAVDALQRVIYAFSTVGDVMGEKEIDYLSNEPLKSCVNKIRYEMINEATDKKVDGVYVTPKDYGYVVKWTSQIKELTCEDEDYGDNTLEIKHLPLINSILLSNVKVKNITFKSSNIPHENSDRLKSLDIIRSNISGKLTISNEWLTKIYLRDNEMIGEIDFTSSKRVTWIRAYNANIQGALDLSHMDKLDDLVLSGNNLTSLKLSPNIHLKNLSLRGSSQIPISDIMKFKNIDELILPYKIECSQKDSLKNENNVTVSGECTN